MPKKTPHLTHLSKALSLLSWLAAMCAKDPRTAVAGGEDQVTRDELLDEREVPWLPIDRGSKPVFELDGLLKTGHAERCCPIPMMLKLSTGLLKGREAIRLTRKGREAAAEYERLRPIDVPAALELVLQMFAFSDKEAQALRATIH